MKNNRSGVLIMNAQIKEYVQRFDGGYWKGALLAIGLVGLGIFGITFIYFVLAMVAIILAIPLIIAIMKYALQVVSGLFILVAGFFIVLGLIMWISDNLM